TPAPALQVGPSVLAFTYTPGGPNPATQVLSIRNPGSGTIAWSIQPSAPWVTLSGTSGNGDADVNVGINVAAIPAGFANSATLSVTAPGAAGSPQTVTVQANQPPTITPTPSNTPLVSPTPTPSRTPTASPTPTRTTTPTVTSTFT